MERPDPILIPSLVIGRRRNGRQVYSDQGKRAVVAACLQPGASIARIALDLGVNANVVRKWIPQYSPKACISSAPLLPVVTIPETLFDQRPKDGARDHSASARIEIVFEKAYVRLHGPVDERSLRFVIDCLTQS